MSATCNGELVLFSFACSPGTYSSRITCALEPPAPKEETPARLRVSLPCIRGCCHSASSCCTLKGVVLKSICGLHDVACNEGTNCLCRICKSTLVNPAMPAAPSACPMFDFTEPIAHHCEGEAGEDGGDASPST